MRCSAGGSGAEQPTTMTDQTSGTTRRNVLKATAGLLGVGATAGCTSEASAALQTCMSSEPTDRELARKKGRTQERTGELSHLPTDEGRGSSELGMGISGREFSASGDGGTAAHTMHIARGHPDTEWWHDRVDMTAYGGPDANEGQPVLEASASALEEGGTTVLLVAENDRGMLASPDAEHFEDLLPERIRREAVGLDG